MSAERNFDSQIAAQLSGKDTGLQEVVERLRSLVKEVVPEAAETVNPWGVPTFEFHGPLCFLFIAQHHVSLGFHRATSLDAPKKLLEGTGKNLRHVKVRTVEDICKDGLRELLAEAARLNREKPVEGMRARRTAKNQG